MTTAPDASSPTTLQTFLPRSMPRTEIVANSHSLFLLLNPGEPTPPEGGAGHSIRTLGRRGAIRHAASGIPRKRGLHQAYIEALPCGAVASGAMKQRALRRLPVRVLARPYVTGSETTHEAMPGTTRPPPRKFGQRVRRSLLCPPIGEAISRAVTRPPGIAAAFARDRFRLGAPASCQ